MRELQIAGLILAIDWRGEELPTDEQILSILEGVNNAILSLSGNPAFVHSATRELGRELGSEFFPDE